MNQKEINKQILDRLGHLEKVVFGKAINVHHMAEIAKIQKRSSLPTLILQLREKEFFKQSKIPQEVHKKLQSIYPCDLNRVEVALLRLHKKRQLRKTSKMVDRKKVIAYVW